MVKHTISLVAFSLLSSLLWAGGIKGGFLSDGMVFAILALVLLLLILAILFSYRYKKTNKTIYLALGALFNIPFFIAGLICLMNFSEAFVFGIILLIPCIISGWLIASGTTQS